MKASVASAALRNPLERCMCSTPRLQARGNRPVSGSVEEFILLSGNQDVLSVVKEQKGSRDECR